MPRLKMVEVQVEDKQMQQIKVLVLSSPETHLHKQYTLRSRNQGQLL